jgi:hypothetical protein
VKLREIGETMSEAIRKATNRTERLELAIEHLSTTDLAMDEKLKLLAKAENYMKYIKQSAMLSRQRIDEHKAEAIGF